MDFFTSSEVCGVTRFAFFYFQPVFVATSHFPLSVSLSVCVCVCVYIPCWNGHLRYIKADQGRPQKSQEEPLLLPRNADMFCKKG